MTTRTLLATVSLALVATGCARHSGGGEGSTLVQFAPAFETRAEWFTGTTVHADAVLRDFNADSYLDVAVVGLLGDFQVMLGGGNGSFSPGQHLDLGDVPITMAAGDLDGDLDLDLAVVRTEIADVVVLQNDGAANFTPVAHLSMPPGAVGVRIADVDANGTADLIACSLEAPLVSVFRGDGTGQFVAQPPLALPLDARPLYLQVGDATRDGLDDLVVCDPEQDRILLFPGSPSGLLATPTAIPVAGGPKALSFGDVDGDGFTDLVVSANVGGEIVVITDATVTPVTSFQVPVGGSPTVTAVADITGDGIADLVACILARYSITVFPGTGSGLGSPQELDAAGLPLRPLPGDLDNDNNMDLVVMSGLGDRLSVYRGREDGFLTGSHSFETDLISPDWITGADFDGDGVPELLTGGNDDTELAVMRPLPMGGVHVGLEVQERIDVGAPVHNLRTADLDQDGRLDVIVPVTGGVKILRNASSPGFLEFQVLPAGAGLLGNSDGPFGVAVGHLNEDLFLDLVVADYVGDRIAVLLGTATPFAFVLGADLTGISRPVDVAIDDFNGDGVMDIAGSLIADSLIRIWHNDGQGNFTAGLDLAVPTAPNYLLTADFDRDGRADLVTSSGDAGQVAVLFGQDDGFTGAEYPAGAGPTALLAEDLTRDGIPDILVSSLVGADFRVMVGDGSGGFPTVFSFPGTRGASGVALQDLNGDDRPELIISSLITTRLSVYRNLTAK